MEDLEDDNKDKLISINRKLDELLASNNISEKRNHKSLKQILDHLKDVQESLERFQLYTRTSLAQLKDNKENNDNMNGGNFYNNSNINNNFSQNSIVQSESSKNNNRILSITSEMDLSFDNIDNLSGTSNNNKQNGGNINTSESNVNLNTESISKTSGLYTNTTKTKTANTNNLSNNISNLMMGGNKTNKTENDIFIKNRKNLDVNILPFYSTDSSSDFTQKSEVKKRFN